MDEWASVREARVRLADLLATLTPDQWERPSLCGGWKVRDVVAHLIHGAELKMSPGMIVDLAKNGFNFDKMNAGAARRRGAGRTPEQLLAEFRAGIPSRASVPGLGPSGYLTDIVAHSYDIGRPLGLPPVATPEADLRIVADRAKNLGFPVGAKKRIAGLRLRASDVDWATGEGPEVSGPLEALIMALLGRKVALEDLTGEGKATLAHRFYAQSAPLPHP
ncbi:MAG TPA: maleylpyruvate isomerase family mycothiol-dependent enzyme [Dehalococcoidia bacterium]|nr:maleylpyruvate isomerase family mycothiol-dependent enzyme [Dehalococcoidia bacterium]